MPEMNCTIYTILISCPSDVSPIVPDIEKAIYRFNRIYGKKEKIFVLPCYYEHSAYPVMGMHPQSILNGQLLDSADMIVSVFWTRFGSPTTHFDSGTEEEIAYMRDRNKQVFLYFLNKPVSPKQFDLQQYSNLMAYQKKVQHETFYCEASDETNLCEQFYDHLKLYFTQAKIGPKLQNSKHKKTILWVDDRPENNVLPRKVFEQYGIDIVIALSTEQALLYFSNMDSITLIISDMGRKEGSTEGYVLLDEIRKLDKAIPFFIFSGSNDPKHKIEALKRGAQGNTGDVYELIEMVTAALIKA